jgi:hypothetical protein
MKTDPRVTQLAKLVIAQQGEISRLAARENTLLAEVEAAIGNHIGKILPTVRGALDALATQTRTDSETTKTALVQEARGALSAIQTAAEAAKTSLETAHRHTTALAGEFDAKLAAVRREFAEKPTLKPRGKYDAGVTYGELEIVELNGSSYVSLEPNNTEKPKRGAKKWVLLVARGAGGAASGPAPLFDFSGIPASVTAAGARGQMACDNNYLYVCTASNTWRRTTLAKWS